MEKILGLDLGVASIGWAMIERSTTTPHQQRILGMGVRIVPLNSDETDEFTKGQPVTTNQGRRMSRSLRRGYYRYRLRKQSLVRELRDMGAWEPESISMNEPRLSSNLQAYSLRSRAASERISLPELGRVLYHLNQKRGYKSNRKTDGDQDGKKLGDYLQEIKDNATQLSDSGMTLGQYFHAQLLANPRYRIKGKTYPRGCYIDEFDRIWAVQAQHHPAVLTEARRKRLRDKIVFWQRPLKSQKGLVSKCTLEPTHRVAPKSSPLFQIVKIWEGLNNVTYHDRDGVKHFLDHEDKLALYEQLRKGGKMKWTEICKELEIKHRDNTPDLKTKESGLEGNTTVDTLAKAFKKLGIDRPELLELALPLVDRVDKETGEVRKQIDSAIEEQPLYRLWHCVYSIEEEEDLQRKLIADFGFTAEQAAGLSRIDFTRQGYGSKCSRVLRRILPYLMQGETYDKACLAAGYRHSESWTVEERDSRELAQQLEVIQKNELRSPIVEKVLNQLIHLVNAILADPGLGRPDQIRIEYGRELQQNAEQRERTYRNNNERDAEAKKHAEVLTEHRVKVNRRNIEKYRLFMAMDGLCPYCGNRMELGPYLKGANADVDHIIPQSRLFDDSFGNKTACHLTCNREKSDKTALEYMLSKPLAAQEQFKERIHTWYQQHKIDKRKRDYFLMTNEEIPKDFIDRDMRLTSFIAKEAGSRLKSVCYKVDVTSGKVTALLRRCWGWDDVLKKLNLPTYRAAGLTYEQLDEQTGHRVTRIKEEYWSKRDDHRHHAIDALVVACTRQDYIEKLNRLNGIQGGTSKKSLEAYFADREQKPFTTDQIMQQVAGILVSINSRKRVVSRSKNAHHNGKVQRSIAPRGALSESTVYGKIQVHDHRTIRLGPSITLEEIDQIVPKHVRRLVQDRLIEHGHDPAKAFKGYKTHPIYLDEAKTQPLLEVKVPTLREEYVVKYKLDANFKAKDAEFIVDKQVRDVVKKHLAAYGDNPREAFREDRPVWLNEAKGVPVKTVRCFTGLSKVVAVSKDEEGRPIGFVKPGNNHHIAIYRDRDGNLHENAVTFWDAVRRAMYHIPAVIRNPDSVWDHVQDKLLPTMTEAAFAELEAQLPRPDWEYLLSMNINEMFVFGMESKDLDAAIRARSLDVIAPHLYRVQSLAAKDYKFRLHTETKVDDKFGGEKNSSLASSLGKMIRLKSIPPLLPAIKVTIDRLGRISRAVP